MFVRMSVALATLASGLVLGNWFLSYPGHLPLAPTDVAKFAAPSLEAAVPQIGSAGTPVATTPQPATLTVSDNRVWPDATVSRAPALMQPDANTQGALTRDIQAELFRLGCYVGPLDGRWTPTVRYALQDFIVRVNATLPVDGPDVALLSLARGQKTAVCGTSATVSVSEQTAFASEPSSGFLPDGSAVSLDGRMSLGATQGRAKPSFSSGRSSREPKYFINPLGNPLGQ